MRLLLALAMTACLQNVDSTALDGGNGHDHFLKLAAQPQILAKNASVGDAPFASQVTITGMTLADRTPFGNDKELTADTFLNDKAPLKFGKIAFNFIEGAKKYDCTLNDSGKIKLSQQIPFSLSNDCKCKGAGCGGANASPSTKAGNDETTAFAKCEELLKHIPNNSYIREGHVVLKYYKDNVSCTRQLNVGWYKKIARGRMEAYIKGESYVPNTSDARQSSAGSFDAAVQFMNNNDITCERGSDGDLKLIFPAFKEGKSIKEINVQCTHPFPVKTQHINIGLDTKAGQKLLITIKHGTQDGATIYDAYDTNDKGQIIKHTRVDANREAKQVFPQ